MSKRFARAVLWALAVLPSAAALAQLQRNDFADAGAALGTLGRLAGIAGLSCLLLAATLSVRLPGFDRLFGGLTSMWRTHHYLGAAAFFLLLAHPLLLGFAAADNSLAAAVSTLVPPVSAWPAWLGWLALIVMMIFLAPSFAFFGEPEYQGWKWVHRLSGAAVLLALVHSLWLSRSLPAPWNWLIWGAMAALAVTAVSYRLVFSRRLGRLRYRVSAVEQPANNVVELSLQPQGRALRYRAGQFVYLTPYDRRLPSGHAEEHPYTLSSSPTEPDLRVAIKDLGDASRAMQHMEPGTRVDVEGPYGDFFPAGIGSEIWIAGGIGVTPFLGRARHLAATGEGADAILVFCVQDESRALFREELEALAQSIDGFTLRLHYFYREGPLSLEFLQRSCTDLARRQAYVCGPPQLNELAQHLLHAAGLRRDHIHTEDFVLL